MRYALLGAALLAVLVAACDGKPKEEQGAMTPAGSDMVAPEAPAEAANSTEPANPSEGSSGGEVEAPAAQPAPATNTTSPQGNTPATAP